MLISNDHVAHVAVENGRALEYVLMWEWDHIRPISKAECDFWMTHILPYGWAILERGALQTITQGSGTHPHTTLQPIKCARATPE